MFFIFNGIEIHGKGASEKSISDVVEKRKVRYCSSVHCFQLTMLDSSTPPPLPLSLSVLLLISTFKKEKVTVCVHLSL